MPLPIAEHPSANFGPRKGGLMPEMVVLHYTAMASAALARDRLCDPQAEVSAHYLISNTGVVEQLVPEEMRAWHAGVGTWRGLDDINSRSIGIELDNRGTHPFSEPQMTSLETVLRGILARWGILPDRVIGHSDMAPGRKVDPGPHFDWARLSRQGLAQAGGGGLEDPDQFRARACAVGYPADVDDATLLQAVRLRFRPQGRGPLSAADVRALPACQGQ